MTRKASLLRYLATVAALLVAVACTPAAQPSPTAASAKAVPTTAAAQPEAKPAATTAPAKPAQSKAEGPAITTAPAKTAASPVAQGAFDEQAVADFYRGKTVKIVVGFAAGGGFDTYSRLIAKHIGEFIPGNPSVIVENMPGAGSMLAANATYNTAPADGTVIANISGPIILNQVFNMDGVQFDMTKFHYLGVPVSESYLMLVKREAGVSGFDQLTRPDGKEIAVGAIPGSTVEHAPVLLRDVLGAKIKVVSGYDGTSKVRLAMESGEVDGFFNTWTSAKLSVLDKIESGEWLILAQMNGKPIAGLPGQVPTILDLTSDEQQRQVLLFGTSYPNQFGKSYVVAPAVPADRVAALQAAFKRTLEDRAFLEEAKQANAEIDPLYPEEIVKLVQSMVSMSAAVKAQLGAVVE